MRLGSDAWWVASEPYATLALPAGTATIDYSAAQGLQGLQGFSAPQGFSAAQGLSAAHGLSASHGLQLASLGAHGSHDASQGLQLAASLVAPTGSDVPPAFLAARGLAMPCAAEAATWSDPPAAATPPAPIESPRATVAALEIRECFFDFIMSSVIGAHAPPAAISGPEALRH